jgi:hypothetical protein
VRTDFFNEARKTFLTPPPLNSRLRLPPHSEESEAAKGSKDGTKKSFRKVLDEHLTGVHNCPPLDGAASAAQRTSKKDSKFSLTAETTAGINVGPRQEAKRKFATRRIFDK